MLSHHSSPIASLHWLKIKEHIEYKLETSFSYVQNFNYPSGHISPQSCISPVHSRHPFDIYRHTVPTRITKCTKIGQLILSKIIKKVATRCQILRLICTKFDFSWGSAPDPAGELTALPQTPWLDFRGLRLRGGKGGEAKGDRKGKEGSGKRKGEGGERGKRGGEGDRDGRESLGGQGEGKGKG